MRNLVIFLCTTLLVILVLLSNSYAQESNINFTHYQLDQGLSDNNVTSITQDKQGFIWVATDNGLNRFDGYNFKVYRNNAKDRSSLPSDYVNAVYVDTSGVLWVATNKGLAKYNPNTDDFTIYQHNPNLPNSISNNSVQVICQIL